MGLKMTLNKENNRLFTDFVDAYWSVDEIRYTTTEMGFVLRCYPSREAKYKNLVPMEHPFIVITLENGETTSIGGIGNPVFDTELYRWECQLAIAEVFPDGIPVSADDQKTAIYEWVKAYSQFPFEDVFENG